MNIPITIGRIVNYVLAERDCHRISTEKAHDDSRIRRVSNPPEEGAIVPVIVSAVWAPTCFNGQAFIDGNFQLWVTSVEYSEDKRPGTWHWPDCVELEGELAETFDHESSDANLEKVEVECLKEENESLRNELKDMAYRHKLDFDNWKQDLLKINRELEGQKEKNEKLGLMLDMHERHFRLEEVRAQNSR